jgi:hypothetical protein
MEIPSLHPDEDVFEHYTFNRLSNEETADFEEHLLICEQCQSTLEKTSAYILMMKAATAAYSVGHPKTSAGRIRLRWSAPAAAILLLTCLTALLSWRTPAGDAVPVELNAYRGSASDAPPGQPLDLKIDLKDVRVAAGYRVEIVDAAGRRVWFGGTPARVSKGLPAGIYWVRLSTDSGEWLREFGLRTDGQK